MDRIVACIDGTGRGMVQTQQLPPPPPGQVQVEVTASLISPGTELGRVSAMRQAADASAPARPFGYACAGKVIRLGDGVTAAAVGDRVTCMGAGHALHATFNNVPVNLTAPIPEAVTDEQAAFAHLAATALNAVRRAAPVFGENAMVAGLGLVGQMVAQLAQASAGHALGIDRLPMRIECARLCGVEAALDATSEDPVQAAARFTAGFGMDYGVIAFGGDATPVFKQLVESLKLTPDGHRMGRIVIVGGARIDHGFASALGNVDVRSSARTGPGYHDQAWEHGQDYPRVFVEWSTRRNLVECMRAIELGRLQVEPLITHRLPLTRIAEAVDELVERPGQTMGVILQPGA